MSPNNPVSHYSIGSAQMSRARPGGERRGRPLTFVSLTFSEERDRGKKRRDAQIIPGADPGGNGICISLKRDSFLAPLGSLFFIRALIEFLREIKKTKNKNKNKIHGFGVYHGLHAK